MVKHILTTLYILVFSMGAFAQSFSSPKHELRAVWLTTIGGLDWPHNYARSQGGIERQKQELCQLLDKYKEAGINTVLLQTRIRGTVIYPSRLEPWDGCLSGIPGQSPGYDPLDFAIEQCHRRGMELHAWVVTLPMGKWNQKGCTSFKRKYSNLLWRIGPDGYMNPEDSRTASYLADICEEITRNYDIDGIHLDYIRYPETKPIKVSRQQGRNYITNIVRAIHSKVKNLKPWIKMSCSPIGKFDDLSRYNSNGWNAYTKVCQDAQGWLRDGLMDQLYPMMYFRANQFFPFALDWAEQSHGRSIAPGLGIYFLNPREGNWRLDDVTRQLHFLRQYNLGQTYFRGKFLTDNEQGIYDFVKQFNAHPALIPPMTWARQPQPEAPRSIEVRNNQIVWTGNSPYYNVYSSREWPVDTDNPENLIAMRRIGTNISLPTEGRFFAVTAMDRYGNESKPRQSHSQNKVQPINIPLLPCDGKHLQLPDKGQVLDADIVLVETLQGAVVDTRTYRGKQLDVSRLPNGYYVLKSLGKKGVTHRLGFFKINRLSL